MNKLYAHALMALGASGMYVAHVSVAGIIQFPELLSDPLFYWSVIAQIFVGLVSLCFFFAGLLWLWPQIDWWHVGSSVSVAGSIAHIDLTGAVRHIPNRRERRHPQLPPEQRSF